MEKNEAFQEFRENFKLLAAKNSKAVINTLSNVFTMRLIGNKTHGDLAEIALSEFINQFMYNYSSKHVGKDLFRAKTHEEDILVTYERTKTTIPVSLKAYGDGPLQLSTDKEGRLFPILMQYGKEVLDGSEEISGILDRAEFHNLEDLNILPLLYNENKKKCNIVYFDIKKVFENTAKIIFVDKGKYYDASLGEVCDAGGRTHPVFLFLDKNNQYLCEVRYGGKSANALQRGFWTHTQRAGNYFDSLTNGWIDYSHNLVLVRLFALALNSTIEAHEKSCVILQQDIDSLKALK